MLLELRGLSTAEYSWMYYIKPVKMWVLHEYLLIRFGYRTKIKATREYCLLRNALSYLSVGQTWYTHPREPDKSFYRRSSI